jgi:ATP-dependent helicase/nuclease subunit A
MRRDESTLWLPGFDGSGAVLAAESADARQRQRALDAGSSFIVQAPAGSGKTELLIQRFLVLLARVTQPESVVAITFTVKAAAEMRARVLEALSKAARGAEPESAHERVTIELAAEALANDARNGWNLRGNPGRLRIQTIDALSMAITRQMPWLARFGAMPEVTDDAREMYREGAQRAIEMLPAEGETGTAVANLIEHLDGNVAGAVQLLAGMLETRDRWLRVMAFGEDPPSVRQVLERSLARVVSEHLSRLREALPASLAGELVELARYAGANAGEGGIAACASLTDLPDDAAGWMGICKLLLTGEGEWRKQPNRSIGFPPHNGRMKQRHKALVEELAPAAEVFRELLAAVPKLPAPRYSEAQWKVLSSLFRLLPVTVAHLRAVFAENGKVDFIEIASAAGRALGEAEQPTDLALAMGSRIEHLLIDEFQDTSVTQFELLRALTSGWDGSPRRTLFLVGDPMQSIYRFRQAEVGLFLNVQQSGVGTISPKPLALSVNFRSAPPIVEWVNTIFRSLFPPEADAYTGAVPYSASAAFQNNSDDGDGVFVHPFLGRDDAAEAELVLRLIGESRSGTTALLVRSRAHLAAIADRLRKAGVRFRAIEIQALAEKPVIQDLLALTRALLHYGDRTAWLSILRAPWCGLTLADLHAIAAPDPNAAIRDRLRSPDLALSEDGRVRLGRIWSALTESERDRGRIPVARLVERAWTALGGNAIATVHELTDARAFFTLLDEAGGRGDLDDFDRFARRVSDLFAHPAGGAEIAVELMTIHKAKGLEFDTVILPGIGKRPRTDDPALLLWSERPVAGSVELLMAPIGQPGDESDTTYDFIRREEAGKTRHESQRLLYVAATRARRRLHLIGHVELNENGELRDPPRDALLAHLWEPLRPSFESLLESSGCPSGAAKAKAKDRTPQGLRRIRVDGLVPKAREGQTQAAAARPPAMYNANELERRIGTATHRLLEQICRDGIEAWPLERIASLQPVLAAAFDLEDASGRVIEALTRTITDPRGRWILAAHAEGRSEFPISAILDGEVRHLVVDRTFVDENGFRWIVDFKTGERMDSGVQKRQLESYAAAMAHLDARPIRLGLYFPLNGEWVEWDPPGS